MFFYEISFLKSYSLNNIELNAYPLVYPKYTTVSYVDRRKVADMHIKSFGYQAKSRNCPEGTTYANIG